MSFGSLLIKFVALFRAARLRQAEALFENTDPSSPASKLLKHKKNHERVSRAIKGIYAGLAVATAECIPLGALQSKRMLFWFIEGHVKSSVFAVILSQRAGDGGIMATLSLVTSWSQCALKFGKLILLKDYLPYIIEIFVASLVGSILMHI